MTQAQLERAVCQATGEARDVVQRIGFSLVIPPKPRPSHRKRRWRPWWICKFPGEAQEQYRPKPA
jgi:hypothetical protein